MPLFSEACSHWDEDWQKLIQNVTIHFQYRRRAASLRHRNRYRTHFASHAPPRDRHGGLFTPHRKLAQGMSLTMRPTKTASLVWKISPLGIFWAFVRNVFGYMYIICDQRTVMVRDLFRGAFIGGNNFVFNPEANSLLFREFLP